jgi:hypothetical protein
VVVAAALQVGLATPAHAQASRVIKLTHAQVEKIIYDGVSESIDKSKYKNKLYWGYKHGPSYVDIVDRADAPPDGVSMAVDLDLAYHVDQFSDPSVDVDFNVDLSCNWRSPRINLVIWDVDARVSGSGLTWLALEVYKLFTGGVHVPGDLIEQKLLDRVEALFPKDIPFCPKFAVSPKGDLTMDFSSGDECNDGTSKHVACHLPTKGSGDDYVCVNGYWIWSDSHCVHPAPPPDEPTPPKGGAQP